MIANLREHKNRIEWIDFAKGLTIILTIIGHTVGADRNGSNLRGIIFSFHMPLFFVLSATTYKFSVNFSDFIRKTKKAAYHLLLPATAIFFLNFLIQSILNKCSLLDCWLWRDIIYTYLFGSGVPTQFDYIYVPQMGIPWFFFALFAGRTIFDYLHLYFAQTGQLFVMTIVVGCCGISFGKLQWLPFSLDIALAIMPLFFFGMQLHTVDIVGNIKMACTFLIIWMITLKITFPDYNSWTYLELACRRYPLFPMCYVTAIFGILFIAEISIMCKKIKPIFSIVSFVGKNSLYLLCVHIMDGCWWKAYTMDGQFRMAAKRTVVDLSVFIVVLLVIKAYQMIKMKLVAVQINNK